MKFHLIPLTSLIPLFLKVYSYPSLKAAKVISVYQKDSKIDSNYRPVSFLPNIEEKVENSIYNRVTKFLNDNNIIYPLQFGFRYNYSINHVLIKLTEKKPS